LQRSRPRLIFVARGRLLDFGSRLVQLRLRELDDRSEAEVVAAVGEIERVGRLREELVREIEPLDEP